MIWELQFPFLFLFRIFYISFNGTIKEERRCKDDITYDTDNCTVDNSGYYHRRLGFGWWGNNRAV